MVFNDKGRRRRGSRIGLPNAPEERRIAPLSPQLPQLKRTREQEGESGPQPADAANGQDWTQNSLHLYGCLSQLLFALQMARDSGNHRLGGEDRKSFKDLLMSVSTLCDVVTQLRVRVSNPTGDSLSPCLLLALSIVSTVIDIYKQAVHMLKTALQTKQSAPTSAQTNPQGVFSSGGADTDLCQWQCSTHLRLQILSDAMSMEFHLEQLKGLFSHVEENASSSSNTLLRLEDVGSTLQALIQKLRMT
ncbi:hypothetical protein DL768_002205 [Monosporascus sp. mg162]|nr:hypothetical protein DL768_002205 [Monosporascus sp. mg162]